MFRSFAPSAFALICALPSAAFADRFEAPAKIDHVTIFPESVELTRLVHLTAPAGEHTVIIPGIGDLGDPQALRILAPDGVTIGAVRLSSSRLPVTGDHEPQPVTEAKAEIERLEGILRDRDDAISAIILRVKAAETQLALLNAMGAEGAKAATDPAALIALVTTVGEASLAAGQAALAARQEIAAANRARQEDADALDKARQTLATLQDTQDTVVVEVTFDTPVASDIDLAIVSQAYGANWNPVYDVALTTGAAPAMTLDRSVFVMQNSGEDWVDVSLTLSTARPGGQLQPQPNYGRSWVIYPETDNTQAYGGVSAPGALAAPVMEDAVTVEAPASRMQTLPRNIGATLVYDYGSRVTLRSGADALKLALGSVSFDAKTWAEANPVSDQTAYRMASFVNEGSEVLLPGRATLTLDGAVVGYADLGLTATGVETTLGFGPIDGLTVEAQYPAGRQGDVGFIAKANEMTTQTVLITHNQTEESWPLLLRTGVGYSGQDDLEISQAYSLAPSRIDPDGQRGVVEWDLMVAPAEETRITIDETLTWPTGFDLQ